MSLESVLTYRILDLWADAPEERGYQYICDTLQYEGITVSLKQVKHRVWLGLVDLKLLNPNKDNTPKDWKRAKLDYKDFRRRERLELN